MWLTSLLVLLSGGWVSALMGFGKALVAVTSLPGMLLFALSGLFSGDAKRPLIILVWLSSLGFGALFCINSYYGFHRIWEEEEAGTATGCDGKRTCAKMSERIRSVPAQMALCDKWERECKWNAWDRAWERYTDIFPTRAQMTATWHYQALALCVVASIGHALLLLTYRCCSVGRKMKRKKDAKDSERLRTDWHAKTETARGAFPAA
jgi:hypothetical protein